MKPILVVSYVGPDLDGVSCAVAYAEFLSRQGRPAVAGVFGDPHHEAAYVLDRFGIPWPEKFADQGDFEQIVFVDSSWLSPETRKVLSPERVIEVIDHRDIMGPKIFPNAAIQNEPVGAAATLVAERFRAKGVEPSKNAAILLYGGIVSNTLNFKGKICTERDVQAARWLQGITGLSAEFAMEMLAAKSDLSGSKLAVAIDGDFLNMDTDGVGIAQLEIIGGRTLLRDRMTEIFAELRGQKEKLKLRFVFMNLLDLGEGITFFVAEDKATQEFLADILDLKFENSVAVFDRLVLRKEFIPQIKEKHSVK